MQTCTSMHAPMPNEHDADTFLSSTHWWCSNVEVLSVHQGEVAVNLPLHSVLLQEYLTHQAPRLMRGGAGEGHVSVM